MWTHHAPRSQSTTLGVVSDKAALGQGHLGPLIPCRSFPKCCLLSTGAFKVGWMRWRGERHFVGKWPHLHAHDHLCIDPLALSSNDNPFSPSICVLFFWKLTFLNLAVFSFLVCPETEQYPCHGHIYLLTVGAGRFLVTNLHPPRLMRWICHTRVWAGFSDCMPNFVSTCITILLSIQDSCLQYLQLAWMLQSIPGIHWVDKCRESWPSVQGVCKVCNQTLDPYSHHMPSSLVEECAPGPRSVDLQGQGLAAVWVVLMLESIWGKNPHCPEKYQECHPGYPPLAQAQQPEYPIVSHHLPCLKSLSLHWPLWYPMLYPLHLNPNLFQALPWQKIPTPFVMCDWKKFTGHQILHVSSSLPSPCLSFCCVVVSVQIAQCPSSCRDPIV